MPTVSAADVLSAEDFFGEFTFARSVEPGFENGFLSFAPDHSWYRVRHVDENKDQVPEVVEVVRGTYRVVAEETGPVLVLTRDDGAPFGRPEAPRYTNGRIESFEIAGVVYQRRRPTEAYFDQRQNKSALAASLFITSTPPGATVVMDGKTQAGKTPLTVDKPTAGEEHEVRLEMHGHMPQTRTITLEEGKIGRLHFDLEEGATALWIRSDPPTRLFIDGVFRGDTPRRLSDVPPGEHEIEFSMPAQGMRHKENVYLKVGERVVIERAFKGKVTFDVGRPVTVIDEKGRLLGSSGHPIEMEIGIQHVILRDVKGREKNVYVPVRWNETTGFETPFDEIED
ncbi:MAG: PEGA domain-containing protein [Deltaproteobacteria bacterium]|nr:PEGA domain-containing protein [Deltaproteobacteria bacterium]